MRRVERLLTSPCFALVIAEFVINMIPGTALASSGPAFSQMLAAGPYIVQVNLYQYPPITDQAVQVTVVPQESGARLSGSILMLPGLGTDAVPLHAQLSLLNRTGTLISSIRLPVRGAWQIEVQLNGPLGAGKASFSIVVAGPGSIPIWLAWLIGATPLLSIALIVWHQRRYRRKLLAQKVQSLEGTSNHSLTSLRLRM